MKGLIFMIILHFALKNDLDVESSNGFYGLNCINKENFISCYSIEKLKKNSFSFSTLKDYIILCIDSEKIKEKIDLNEYENSDNLELKLYNPIPIDSIIEVLPYTFNKDDKFVPTDELLDYGIINTVCSKLNLPFKSKKYFHDGTTSRIILLNNEYIIKMASKEQLKAENTFAKYYENIPKLQKVAYCNEEFNFIVYDFIPGDIMHTVVDFENLEKNIKFIVSAYKNYTQSEFGYIESPVKSWSEFLRNEVENTAKYFNESKNMIEDVYSAIENLNKFPFEKKLIHGDFGAHNFIKRDEKFIAVIDPMPIAGDPSYDVLYALVSNIDIIPFLSIDYLTSFLKEPKEKIESLLKVVLFCRICKCVKYNKEDLESYLDFWDNLFN